METCFKEYLFGATCVKTRSEIGAKMFVICYWNYQKGTVTLTIVSPPSRDALPVHLTVTSTRGKKIRLEKLII